jgi:hypothetical protein
MVSAMGRLRSLLWLISLLAFLAPSFGTASMAHVAQPPEQAASADCPDHAPPPDCPAQGTAKHAAGQCCPLMAGIVALLPPVALVQAAVPYHVRPATIARNLIGLTFTQDPPPPRV